MKKKKNEKHSIRVFDFYAMHINMYNNTQAPLNGVALGHRTHVTSSLACWMFGDFGERVPI